MDKIIYLENRNQTIDVCSGQKYMDFIEYAFKESQYFMLVYVNYYGKGYTSKMKFFKKNLKPFQVKTRTNPSWPGVPHTYCPNTSYKVIFYKNDPKAKEYLKLVTQLSDWSAPSYPQDLAFFKGNKCWFYSVGHEKIGAIIRATERDLDFLEKEGLAMRKDVCIVELNHHSLYDELIE